MKKRHIIPGVDQTLLVKDAAKLMPDPMRRQFLRGAASVGALAFLTGCAPRLTWICVPRIRNGKVAAEV